jgi:hypothetical protein
MKKVCFTILIILFSTKIFSQTVFADSFDTYIAGQQLACQNPVDWTTWNLVPCNSVQDGYVSNIYAHSGANSVVIVPDNDLVHLLGDVTSGKYKISFWVYIPANKQGYFNTMSGFSGGVYDWAMYVYFYPGGNGTFTQVGGSTIHFYFAYDTWQLVELLVDLDNNIAEFYFSNNMVSYWPWTLGIHSSRLAAFDFYGIPESEMYYDDFKFELLRAPIIYIMQANHSNGSSDGSVLIGITDSSQITGHDYEMYFTERQEVLDFYGDWVPAGAGTKLNKPSDLTGTSISVGAAWGDVTSEVKLNFSLNLVSSTNAWADGITITLPAGMAIVDAPSFNAGGGPIVPEVSGNVIKMGLTNGELTQNGIFHGGETWSIIVNTFTPPIDIDWRVFDDGFTDPAGPIVDAAGTVNITQIGELRTAKYWNLKDVTIGVLKLENQGIIDGVYLFPPRNDLTNLVNNPIVDGLQIKVMVNYFAPTTISRSDPPTVNGVDLTFSAYWYDANYILTDFTYFGLADATASTTLPLYGGVAGTLDVNQLQQDYEIRWTGVVGDTTLGNGDTLTITKSGGSYITLFGASGKSIANHPLNPNPGSTTPFTVRVPFEIWNMDSNQEITALFWDRTPSFDANGGSVWNQGVREYLWVVNTPQSNTPIDPTSQIAADYATWNWVLYKSFFELGDIMKINYDNPIQIGIDTWSFNLSAATFANVDKAKSEINKINVFPNPYYGVNSEELNKYNRFVTFSHLPAKATVRIFNLAGVLVKTIEKDDPNQFLRWNLQNNSGLPVASGLYIAYIELPDLGETKILKVAIIQEQQILDRF